MDKTTIAGVAREIIAASPDLAAAHTALAGRLNEAGMIIKQLAIVRFEDGRHAVFVSDDGNNVTVEIEA